MSSFDPTKFKLYLDYETSVHGVKLPNDINYLNLVRYVKKKYDIKHNSISLHYKTGLKTVDLSDDDDVDFFVTEVCCNQKEIQTLYIKNTGKTLEVNPSSSSKPFDFDLNVSLFPEEYNYQTPKVEQDNNEKPKGEQDNYEHKEENTNEANLPQWQRCTFINMPSPPHAPNPVVKHINTRGSDVKSIIRKDDIFDDKEAVVKTIGEKSLREMFEYRIVKSCKRRFTVKCVDPNCNWNIYTRKDIFGPKFHVSSVNDVHTCSTTKLLPNHRNAKCKLVGQLLVDKLRDSSRMYTANDIKQDFKVDWKINISYKRAWGGKNEALRMLTGCPKDSFAQLPYYCYNLKLANEGTVTHIETDDEGQFKMVFIAWGVAIRSFLRHMRPLIIIDAAHLKGTYLGTNLLAVGMDGNNQIVPIATGVSQGETNESWGLFMTKLKECIGDVEDLAIISDRHQAIIHACRTVFPNAFHGYCCRHLMMNCNLKGKKWRGIYWKMCKAYTEQEFDKLIHEIQAKKPEAYKKLVDAGFDKWSRVYCPTYRYNYLTSNSAESINSLTRHVRKVPITMLMEYYRKLLQKWYCDRRYKYKDAPKGELTNWAAAKVNDRINKSANWQVNCIEMFKEYQVIDDRRVHIVYFQKGECTCNKWQLSGLPCGHVCAVCRESLLTNCRTWAYFWFTKTALKATYEEKVYPLQDVSKWRAPGEDPIQVVKPPAMVKRQAGRPKDKDRIPSKNEDPIIKSCGRCGNTRHTRGSCNVPLADNKKRKTNKDSCTPKEEWKCESSTPHNNFTSQPGSSSQDNLIHLDDL